MCTDRNFDRIAAIMESMGKPMDKLREQADELCRNWHDMASAYDEYAKSLDLSYTSLYVLDIIYRKKDACTQKSISEETFFPKQTINAIIRGFWKKGYVKLVEVDADRRNKTVHLTRSGKAFADAIIPKIQRAEDEALKRLNEKQRAVLIQSAFLYTRRFRECMSEYFPPGDAKAAGKSREPSRTVRRAGKRP